MTGLTSTVDGSRRPVRQQIVMLGPGVRGNVTFPRHSGANGTNSAHLAGFLFGGQLLESLGRLKQHDAHFDCMRIPMISAGHSGIFRIFGAGAVRESRLMRI
jgi:hypothetical protein